MGFPPPNYCRPISASNRCGVHAAKPLGCVTFTPVRDGGCDQDTRRLDAALAEAATLNDQAYGAGEWEDLPFPVAMARRLGTGS